ncbi:MAG: hypothetical protein ACOX87_16190 [Chloroflexota bacterium]|jgi:hypothetical protein
MYEYRIAVPADSADEVENVLQGVAEVRREGTMPTPNYMAASEEWAIEKGEPLAILCITGPTLQSVSNLKNWLDNRFADPYVDIRLADEAGVYLFSFQSHGTEEIKDRIKEQAASKRL